MSTPIIVEDIRPLIALIAPWFGLIGIMLAGKRAIFVNYYFFSGFSEAAVISMLPVILGEVLLNFTFGRYFPMFPRYEDDGQVFFCLGCLYTLDCHHPLLDRIHEGLHEHQTRFYSFCSVAFCHNGGSFSSNLLTIYFL